MSAFRLGVNYWPRETAMAMWSRLDFGAIDDDFAHIHALGLRAVRFFLRWSDFAPRPGDVARDALANFVRLLDVADRHGLVTMPTLFCGHMSGVNWLPSWALDERTPAGRFRTMTERGESPYGAGDFYTGELLDAERMLARELGVRAREHRALAVWDLGNEFSNVREPASPRDAAHWSAALTHDLFETSNVAATGGLHGEDLEQDRRIRPSSIAVPWPYATMHGYSVYSRFARGRLDPDVVPFLCELTSSCARKRVLFSEFGNPACPREGEPAGDVACLSEFEMAEYASRVLDRLQRRGALGAYWWCWTDYAPARAATPPFDRAAHELRFGLVRADGSEKPVAHALAAFAREGRAVADVRPPIVEEAPYFAGLPATLDRAYAAYCEEHGLAEEVS